MSFVVFSKRDEATLKGLVEGLRRGNGRGGSLANQIKVVVVQRAERYQLKLRRPKGVASAAWRGPGDFPCYVYAWPVLDAPPRTARGLQAWRRPTPRKLPPRLSRTCIRHRSQYHQRSNTGFSASDRWEPGVEARVY